MLAAIYQQTSKRVKVLILSSLINWRTMESTNLVFFISITFFLIFINCIKYGMFFIGLERG